MDFLSLRAQPLPFLVVVFNRMVVFIPLEASQISPNGSIGEQLKNFWVFGETRHIRVKDQFVPGINRLVRKILMPIPVS